MLADVSNTTTRSIGPERFAAPEVWAAAGIRIPIISIIAAKVFLMFLS